MIEARLRRVFGGLLAVAAIVGLAACTSSAVSGAGSAAPAPSASLPTSEPGFPSEPASAAPSSGGLIVPSSAVPRTAGPAPSSSAARSYEKALTFTGSTTGQTYRALIWDTDDIGDCSTHAYGAAMIAFLRQHPCDGARRVLATLELGGRTVDVSLISTGFPPAGSDLYRDTAKFVKLELADGTGSINDLLSEGGYLPGATRIPSDEAFDVLAEDNGATVLDAWYADGPTKNQAKALLKLDEDLFLSPLQDG